MHGLSERNRARSDEVSGWGRYPLPPIPFRCVWLLLVLLTLLGVPSLVASSQAAQDSCRVEILVRDELGQPVPETRVTLTSPPSDGRAWRSFHRESGRSDESGRIGFDGLPCVRYQVDVWDLDALGLVEPRNNPYSPSPRFSLAEGESRAVEVVLHRGVEVAVELLVDGWPTLAGSAVLEHRDSGQQVRLPVTTLTGRSRRQLPRGRWQVTFEPPSGFLLTGVHHNGLELATPMASLDLDTEPFPTTIGFTLSAQARVSGQASTNLQPDERRPDLRFEAALLTAGEWGQDERARSGSSVSPVVRSFNWRDRIYELPLPSGRWRLAPVSDRPMTADPPAVDFAVSVGEELEFDFEIEFLEDDQPLLVSVVDERRQRVEGATVAAATDGGSFPSLKTGRSGQAALYAVDEGVVVSLKVTHPDFLEGDAAVEFRTDRDSFRPAGALPAAGDRVQVKLDRGAGVELEAFDLEGRALPGVELMVEELDDDETTGSTPRSVVTGRRGEAAVTGLLVGRYRVSVAMKKGSDRELGFLVLEELKGTQPSDGESALVLDLGSEDRRTLLAQLVPAAYFETSLLCTDGEPVPPSVDVQVFRAVRHLTESVSETVRDDHPALELESRMLEGSALDRLRVGPLDAGAFELAITPEGFDRPTWAFETSDRAAALQLEVSASAVEAGRAIDLGEFLVECDPALRVVLSRKSWIAPGTQVRRRESRALRS